MSRLFKILLTVLIVFIVGYFIFTATQVELAPSEDTATTVEKAGAV